MNNDQILLTSLLSTALRNQNIESLNLQGADWNSIYEEAKAHEVHTIIYPLIKNHDFSQSSDKMLIAKWQKQTLMSGISQINHMEQMNIIFNKFNNSKIRFIALKGLVLRDLYPNPEMRTMSDADILVEQKDIKKACTILLKMGYKKDGTDSKHIHFKHDTYMCIEIHLFLISKGTINKSFDEFETNVWKNAKTSIVCNSPSLVLSKEDQILHLILHMAAHLSSSGFGLRQLCDFFMIIEKRSCDINWIDLSCRISEYGITSFTFALFKVCKNLFNISIPEVFKICSIDENCVDALIEDIFSGGIFGRRTLERDLNGIQLQYIDPVNSKIVYKKWRNIISFLFPSVNKLALKYSYAKKFPILTPAAWSHRLLYGFFRRDFTLAEKITILVPIKSTSDKVKNRIILLHQLDLK